MDNNKNKNDIYYIYMLRCSDNSLYTGITPDIKSRVKTHYYKQNGCAKYTRSHDVTAVEAVWQTDSKVTAAKLEYKIKKLIKSQKEDIISKKTDLSSLTNDAKIIKRVSISLLDCLK